MAKIKLQDIINEAEKHKWKVQSPSYKNLSSEMVFECDKGHTIYAPYKKIRDKWECPFCKEDAVRKMTVRHIDVEPKHKDIKRILALDQATHTTGYSIYDGKKYLTSGVFVTTKEDEIERVSELQKWLINMCENWKIDLVGLEDIQLQIMNGKVIGVTTYKMLAHLQGILMMTLYNLKTDYKIVSPSTWRHHNNIKGRSRSDKKKGAVLTVKNNLQLDVSDDEADAILIGKYLADTLTSTPIHIENWET